MLNGHWPGSGADPGDLPLFVLGTNASLARAGEAQGLGGQEQPGW